MQLPRWKTAFLGGALSMVFGLAPCEKQPLLLCNQPLHIQLSVWVNLTLQVEGRACLPEQSLKTKENLKT